MVWPWYLHDISVGVTGGEVRGMEGGDVRSSTTVPEKCPLQTLVTLEVVFETEGVVLVGELLEVEHFGRGFHYWEGWILGVIDEGWDTACIALEHASKQCTSGTAFMYTIRIQSQEPILLLHIRHNIDHRCCPLRSIRIRQFLQENLHRLTIGRIHRNEMQTLSILHLRRRVVLIQIIRHLAHNLLLMTLLILLSSESNAFQKRSLGIRFEIKFTRIKTSQRWKYRLR